MTRQHVVLQNDLGAFSMQYLLQCSRIIIRGTDSCLVYGLAKPIIKGLDIDDAFFSFLCRKNNVIPPQ